MLSNGNTVFIFIRHAESEKNLVDITGGNGKPLTHKGKNQAWQLALDIKRNLSNCNQKINVFSAPAVQAQETAEIVAKVFKIEFKVCEELLPASLGVVDGLSRDDMKKRFPNILEMLDQWRNGEIEVVDLDIEGMERPESFWDRMLKFLHKVNNCEVNIVVCTRSIMVLIANFLKGNKPIRGGCYKHVVASNCEILSFSIDNNNVLEPKVIDIFS